MSNETVYYPKSTDPTELTGLYSRGQMLPKVEEFQQQVAREARAKYMIDTKKNQTGENANMNKKRVER